MILMDELMNSPYVYAVIYEWPPSDGQSQKDDDDDGHLRNELCALWTDAAHRGAHLLNGNF